MSRLPFSLLFFFLTAVIFAAQTVPWVGIHLIHHFGAPGWSVWLIMLGMLGLLVEPLFRRLSRL